ncbi:MAG TPA: HIT family protein [Candidatus Paceibacterota bacterium]
MEDCIFCKIVKKDIPAEIVYENENYLAFMDIKPINQGHVVLVPKEHSRTFLDFVGLASKNGELVEVLQKIGGAVKNGTGANGLNISTNIERAGGQIIFHTHFHIIPRFDNDGLVHWPHKEGAEKNFAQIASQIRANLK